MVERPHPACLERVHAQPHPCTGRAASCRSDAPPHPHNWRGLNPHNNAQVGINPRHLYPRHKAIILPLTVPLLLLAIFPAYWPLVGWEGLAWGLMCGTLGSTMVWALYPRDSIPTGRLKGARGCGGGGQGRRGKARPPGLRVGATRCSEMPHLSSPPSPTTNKQPSKQPPRHRQAFSPCCRLR